MSMQWMNLNMKACIVRLVDMVLFSPRIQVLSSERSSLGKVTKSVSRSQTDLLTNLLSELHFGSYIGGWGDLRQKFYLNDYKTVNFICS